MRFKSATLPLVGINVAIFFMQVVLGSWFTSAFLLESADVLSRPWILVTSMFLHGSLMHLLFNMYALFIFGPLIEARIGTRRFVYLYFLSGILASIASTFFYDAALGASGAIMGILGITIMLMPHLQVLFFFVVPMSLRTAGFLFALLDIFGLFHETGIANVAHLVGMGVGLLYGWYLMGKKKSFNRRFTSDKTVNMRKKGDTYEQQIMMDEKDIDDYLKHGRL